MMQLSLKILNWLPSFSSFADFAGQKPSDGQPHLNRNLYLKEKEYE